MRCLFVKKLIILSTVLILVLSLFVTFSTAAAAETQKVKITYLRWTQPPMDEMYSQIAKDFMAKNPNVEINILFYPHPDLTNKIRTAMVGGDEMDCFVVGSEDSAWFMENNTVEEIMPSAFGKQSVEEVVDMWEPGSIKTAGRFGRINIMESLKN